MIYPNGPIPWYPTVGDVMPRVLQLSIAAYYSLNKDAASALFWMLYIKLASPWGPVRGYMPGM